MIRTPCLLMIAATLCIATTYAQDGIDEALVEVAVLDDAGNYEEMLKVLAPFRESGDAEVEFYLALAMMTLELDRSYADPSVEPDVEEAIFWAKRAAEHGSGPAMNLLSVIYGNAMGVTQDLALARDYLRRGVEAGDEGAILNNAVVLYDESGDADPRVCDWFELLADSDEPNIVAIYYLGIISYKGQCGGPADEAGGVELIRMAAEAGFDEAEWDMGRSYEYGWIGDVDIGASIAWYSRAAEQGHPNALWKIGMAYATGAGLPQDSALAVDHFQRAADAGDIDGFVSLAVMYASGDGVTQDFARARELYEVAVQFGNPTAMRNLAVMHASGEGMQIDLVEARVLVEMAIALGDNSAIEIREWIVPQLTAEEAASAEEEFARRMSE